MRKNKYDDKFYAKYKIRKIVNTKQTDNDDSGLIGNRAKPSGTSLIILIALFEILGRSVLFIGAFHIK